MHLKSRDGNLYVRFFVEDREIVRSLKLEDTKKNRTLAKKVLFPELARKIASGEYKKVPKTVRYYSQKYLALQENMKSYRYVECRVEAINKAFGDKTIDSITKLNIKEWLNSFKIKNISKKNYLVALKGIFQVAYDDEVIAKNIASEVSIGRYEQVEADPFSEEEVSRLLAYANDEFKNYLGIAFNTGMRIGEILGLMLQDIDEDSISIKRAVSRNSKEPTTPKTQKSIRKIPILDACRPYLEDQIRRAREKRTMFLFMSEVTGKFYHDADALKKKWLSVLKRSKVRHRKLYNTRHTFATAMLRSGKVSVLTVAKMLGHTNSKMVLTTYSGFIEAEELKIDRGIALFSEGTKEGTFRKMA
ncbi:tyrosine-type recombinase/integrase [Sulfurospirillum deleyianum]|uniref:Integrase family protein n=1 Tax=Sulfurospirillum deleyianum (strain ATCC 51133 / DSM 6946 / 5175) TaxID=525898 RepID=D1B4J0_SULD5|nr:site-specific integrase [Sulfurospirillum deleyianum]ACZ13010.1 integrase family protein [Sulfurospirillum deleyianum DSM 6946]